MINIDNVLKSHGIGVGGGGTIKSVQRGISTAFDNTTTTSTTITISAVVTANSIVRVYPGAIPGATSAYFYSHAVCVDLTNSTTISLTRERPDNKAPAIVWEVIEFNDAKTKQTGIATINDDTFIKNVTISTVEMSKALVFISWIGISANSSVNQHYVQPYLTSNTNLRIDTQSYYGLSVHWQVIEFK